MRPLLIVDGDNLAHRAYHSTPKSVTGANGEVINAVVGFFSMLTRIWQEEQPRAVFVGWDTLGVDTYRNRLWPPYQGGRIFEREIVRQLDLLPPICQACGLGIGKGEGYEADDFMAASAVAEAAAGGTALILTTDKDSYQLVSEQITVISPKRGTRELERITTHEVVIRFGVLPEQVPDFKALAGDASDKIPGMRGIGPQAASRMLLQYGTLEGVIENCALPEPELALKFREVARMQLDAPVSLPVEGPDWTAGAEALRVVGAGNLADRVAVLATA